MEGGNRKGDSHNVLYPVTPISPELRKYSINAPKVEDKGGKEEADRKNWAAYHAIVGISLESCAKPQVQTKLSELEEFLQDRRHNSPPPVDRAYDHIMYTIRQFNSGHGRAKFYSDDRNILEVFDTHLAIKMRPFFSEGGEFERLFFNLNADKVKGGVRLLMITPKTINGAVENDLWFNIAYQLNGASFAAKAQWGKNEYNLVKAGNIYRIQENIQDKAGLPTMLEVKNVGKIHRLAVGDTQTTCSALFAEKLDLRYLLDYCIQRLGKLTKAKR